MDGRAKVTSGVESITPGWSVSVLRRATITIVAHTAYAHRVPFHPGPDASPEEIDLWLREQLAFEAGQ